MKMISRLEFPLPVGIFTCLLRSRFHSVQKFAGFMSADGVPIVEE
jgi:hypothetical protein